MTTSSGDLPDDGLKAIQEDMAIDDACDLAGKPSAVSKQRLGFCEIGGAYTVEQLDKNTITNAISFLCTASFKNLVLLLTPSLPFVQLPFIIWLHLYGSIVNISHDVHPLLLSQLQSGRKYLPSKMLKLLLAKATAPSFGICGQSPTPWRSLLTPPSRQSWI